MFERARALLSGKAVTASGWLIASALALWLFLSGWVLPRLNAGLNAANYLTSCIDAGLCPPPKAIQDRLASKASSAPPASTPQFVPPTPIVPTPNVPIPSVPSPMEPKK